MVHPFLCAGGKRCLFGEEQFNRSAGIGTSLNQYNYMENERAHQEETGAIRPRAGNE
jgi:hypothetical protein